jgi:apolipoprotein N-acyltransferase
MAVENRLNVVRSPNIGISAFIAPYERIVDRVKDEKGQDIFVRGVMTGWVIPLDSKTIYTRHGDWFVWVAMGVSVIFLAIAALKARKK